MELQLTAGTLLVGYMDFLFRQAPLVTAPENLKPQATFFDEQAHYSTSEMMVITALGRGSWPS